ERGSEGDYRRATGAQRRHDDHDAPGRRVVQTETREVSAVNRVLFRSNHPWIEANRVPPDAPLAHDPGAEDLSIARPLPRRESSGRTFSGTFTADRTPRSHSGSSSKRGMTWR